jgi:hypothetical protein
LCMKSDGAKNIRKRSSEKQQIWRYGMSWIDPFQQNNI